MPKTRSRHDAPPTPRPFVRTTPNFADPPFWPTGHRTMALIEKFHAYCAIATPDHVQALHLLLDSLLREQWWAVARSNEGLEQLVRLVQEEDQP